MVTISMLLMAGLAVLGFGAGPAAGVAIPTTISTDTDITVDTTWDSGTCDMSANVTVKSGATLTIQDLTIIMDAPAGGGGGGNNTTLSSYTLTKYFGLRVESGGTLDMTNVTIKGKDSSERWNIISQGTLSIADSNLRDLDYGGIVIDGDDGIGTSITGTTITNSRDGIEVNSAEVTVSSNTFQSIDREAVYISSGNATVDNNTFTSAGWTNIYFDDSDIDIFDNDFSEASSYAIYGYYSVCAIEHNDIQTYNEGIYLSDSDCSIRNNTIDGIGQGSYAIMAYDPPNEYQVNDNHITDMYLGIRAESPAEIVNNHIERGSCGIYARYGSGGGHNYTMNDTSLGGMRVLTNNITDMEYYGIRVYEVNDAWLKRNTLTSIGENWNTGYGIGLTRAGGEVHDNYLYDIKGNGMMFEEGGDSLDLKDNHIEKVVSSNSLIYRGAVAVRYSSAWTEWDFGPDAFEIIDTDVVLSIFRGGTVNLRGMDLTGDGVGKSMDLIVYSEYEPATLNLYDVEYDAYQLQLDQWSDNARAEINVHWTTALYGEWESNGQAVQDGTLTVTDAEANEVFHGGTDMGGWTGSFEVLELSDAMFKSNNNSNQQQTTDHNPHTFHLQRQVGSKNHHNTSSLDITGTTNITMVLDDVPPLLDMASPLDGALVNTTSIEVKGTTELLAAIKVNGLDADVDPDGNFSVTVPLDVEGANTITAVSTDKGDNVVTKAITVIRDTTLPPLTLERPEQGAIYNTLAMAVQGQTEPNGTVTVQGQVVTVGADGSFGTVVNYTREGLNEVLVSSTDLAGNTRTRLVNFTIDVTPPPLIMSKPVNNSVTRSPTADVKGSTENGAMVKVNGQMIFFDNFIFETTVSLVEGSNTITVVATDVAGNTRTAVLTVVRDSTPPALEVTSPTPNLQTSRDRVTVTGTTDVDATVTVNGVPVKVENGTFTDIVYLSDGSNKITVEATDPVGNVASKVLKVYKVPGTGPVEPIDILEPANNTLTNEATVTIKGSVTEAGTLAVNGINITLAPDDSFEYNVSLLEGKNVIKLSLKDDMGNHYSVEWVIYRDTTPPEIVIMEPEGTVKVPNILVKGSTEPGAFVTVNGLMVYVSPAGQFTAPVNLNPGKNIILVTAVDEAGNSKSVDVEVKYEVKDDTGGAMGLESSTSLGLMALLLVLVVLMMLMMGLMMGRMRGRTQEKVPLPEEDEEEEEPSKEEEE